MNLSKEYSSVVSLKEMRAEDTDGREGKWKFIERKKRDIVAPDGDVRIEWKGLLPASLYLADTHGAQHRRSGRAEEYPGSFEYSVFILFLNKEFQCSTMEKWFSVQRTVEEYIVIDTRLRR